MKKLMKDLKSKKVKPCPYAKMESDHHEKVEKMKSHKHKKKAKKVMKKTKKKVVKAVSKGEKKIKKVMKEYKSGKLHSGSKKGPVVKKRSQAIAIALSEARKKKHKK